MNNVHNVEKTMQKFQKLAKMPKVTEPCFGSKLLTTCRSLLEDTMN